MAAKSSSWAVLCRFHPRVTPRRLGFTNTVRSPLSHVMRSKPVCPARYFSKPSLSLFTSVAAREAIALNMSPTAESPASMPVRRGCTLPFTTPQTPGTRLTAGGVPMMHRDGRRQLTRSQRPRDWIGGCVHAGQFFPHSAQERIDLGQKTFRRKATELGIPQPLVAHGADAAFCFSRIGDTAKRSRDHVAMLEGGSELRPFIWIVAQPMQ